jgi:predicted glycosyltransferase involved in capsule biosynthesis
MLTIVTPIRLTTHRRRSALRRLSLLLTALPREIGAVIVDDSADPRDRAAVAEVVKAHPNARHLLHPESAGAPFSVGRLRDAGAEAAPDGLVMFHDVDFFAPQSLYRRLAAHLDAIALAKSPNAFACVPVAFLSQFGSRLARMAPGSVWPALSRPRARRLGIVDRIVLGSSAIVLHRRTLLDGCGHDETFSGHGAEDFELMHRLSLAYPKGARPADFHVDYGSRAADTGGFRAYFGGYGAPLLAEGLYLAHDWHPPRREDPRYYAARQDNFARFNRLIR